jgi:hypothetical protein
MKSATNLNFKPSSSYSISRRWSRFIVSKIRLQRKGHTWDDGWAIDWFHFHWYFLLLWLAIANYIPNSGLISLCRLSLHHIHGLSSHIERSFQSGTILLTSSPAIAGPLSILLDQAGETSKKSRTATSSWLKFKFFDPGVFWNFFFFSL